MSPGFFRIAIIATTVVTGIHICFFHNCNNCVIRSQLYPLFQNCCNCNNYALEGSIYIFFFKIAIIETIVVTRCIFCAIFFLTIAFPYYSVLLLRLWVITPYCHNCTCLCIFCAIMSILIFQNCTKVYYFDKGMLFKQFLYHNCTKLYYLNLWFTQLFRQLHFPTILCYSCYCQLSRLQGDNVGKDRASWPQLALVPGCQDLVKT